MKTIHNNSFGRQKLKSCFFFLLVYSFFSFRIYNSTELVWYWAILMGFYYCSENFYHQKQMISTEIKMKQSVLLAYWCIPYSFSFFFFSSEHVFEHFNTEVLCGPDRHFLTNIRAYFGKWWNPSYLKTCWLLIYMLICTGKKSRIYTSSLQRLSSMCIYAGCGTYRGLSLLRLRISKVFEKNFLIRWKRKTRC